MMQSQNPDSVENGEQLHREAEDSAEPAVYKAQPVPHKTQANYPPSNPISPMQNGASSDLTGNGQYYAQQLIDMLQKRNRFMGVLLAMMVLIAVAAAFGAFRIYIDYQSAMQNVTGLQREEGAQQQEITALQEKLDQAQVQYTALNQAKGDSDTQVEALTAKLLITNQMVETLKTNLDVTKAQAEQLAQENSIIRSALDTTAAGKEKTLSLIDEKEKLMQQQRDQLAFHQQQNTTLKSEVENRKNAFEALSKRYQNIKDEIFSLEQTLDQSNRQISEKNKEIKRLQSQLVNSQTEQDKLTTEYQALQKSLRSVVQPVAPAPVSASAALSSADGSSPKKPAPPLTPDQIKTMDIPDQVIIDLN